jgi:peptidyl-prolyl cis-trans isomerase A (cyclophilin A)
MPDRTARFSVLALGAALLAAAPHPAKAPAAKPVDVAIRTSLGTIVVRLDTAAAPITTKNFLHYVDAGTYNGATFYRTVRRTSEPQASIEVIQGGLNSKTANPMIQPIPLEPTSKTHLHNTDGTIAMARTSDPNSGSTEFFIDIGDDRFLDAGGPTGPGYAAFGKVVRGMDVVRKIQRANATGESLSPPITIVSIKRS